MGGRLPYEPTDGELVIRFRGGDVSAFEALVARHERRVYNLAYRMLGRAEDARDATQEAFLSCYRNLAGFRGDSAFATWLHRIAMNACYDLLRRHLPEPVPDEELHPTPTGDHADAAIAAADVERALARVPDEFRAVLVLHDLQGFRYEEIATILDVPLGTVRSRLNQVKVKLAEALLKTTGLEHDEPRRLAESQTRFFTAVFDEYSGGQGYETLAGALADDFVRITSNGLSGGLGGFLEELEDDLETGMKLHLTNIIASREMTVIEGDLENPPDNPFHCPPATSQVYFYRDGRICLIREYFAPRPERREQAALKKP
jgi:RNA polymerase sigma-70 factor (ECF subfamily)